MRCNRRVFWACFPSEALKATKVLLLIDLLLPAGTTCSIFNEIRSGAFPRDRLFSVQLRQQRLSHPVSVPVVLEEAWLQQLSARIYQLTLLGAMHMYSD